MLSKKRTREKKPQETGNADSSYGKKLYLEKSPNTKIAELGGKSSFYFVLYDHILLL